MSAKRPGRIPKVEISAKHLADLIRRDWRDEVVKRYTPRICKCLEILSDEEIWWRPNGASNSVGNIALHLCGNMRQWIIAGLGGEPDIRERDLEFSEKGPISRSELIDNLRRVVNESSRLIARLIPESLARNYSIQGYRVNGYVAATHVASHFSYHAGQIIYITKMKHGEDLGFTKLPTLKARAKK